MPEAALLPDLGLATAALFLLLIAAALWVLMELIRQSFGRIPVIGSWIQSNINGALNDARLAVLDAAKDSWQAAVRLFHWIQNWLWNILMSFFDWSLQAVATVQNIVDVQIPNLQARVEVTVFQWISNAVSTVRLTFDAEVAQVRSEVAAADRAISSAEVAALTYATRLFDEAVAEVKAGIVTAESWAANEVVQLDRALSAELANLRAQVAADLATAESLAAGLFRTVETDLTREVASAEALAFAQVQALQRGIYTDLETWGDQAVNVVWPDALGDLRALRDTLGADFPWLNDLIGALAGLGAAGLLGALIRALAGTQAITRLATDCIVPTCRNLSGLGRDLADLGALFSAGIMFAWLAEGVAHPGAWAADVQSFLGPIADRTVATARTTFGV